ELAADARGPRCARGNGPYLAALSRMALRQDGARSCWPARAFLPAKGTFIRRIEMLRKSEDFRDRPWSPAGRRVVGASLLALSLGIWALTGVVRGGADGSPSENSGEPV